MQIDRRALHNELHARPSLYFHVPAAIFHLAFVGRNHDLAQLVQEEKLAQSVCHLGGLLQARAQVELEAQNSQILQNVSTATRLACAWTSLPP